VLTVLVLGCNQTKSESESDQSIENKTTRNETNLVPAGQGPKRDQPKGSWLYKSDEHGFSIRLPSSNWKQDNDKTRIASFWCNPNGSAMLAGVFSVKRQTDREFQDGVASFKAEINKMTDLLVKPKFEQGINDSGNKFTYVTLCEQGQGEFQYIY